jgi:hypothetical protein
MQWVNLGSAHFVYQSINRAFDLPGPGFSSDPQMSGIISAIVSALYRFSSLIDFRPASVNLFIFVSLVRTEIPDMVGTAQERLCPP